MESRKINFADFNFMYELKQFYKRVDMKQFVLNKRGELSYRDKQRIFIAFLEYIVEMQDDGVDPNVDYRIGKSCTKKQLRKEGMSEEEIAVFLTARRKELRKIWYEENGDKVRAAAREYAAKAYADGRKKEYMEKYHQSRK